MPQVGTGVLPPGLHCITFAFTTSPRLKDNKLRPNPHTLTHPARPRRVVADWETDAPSLSGPPAVPPQPLGRVLLPQVPLRRCASGGSRAGGEGRRGTAQAGPGRFVRRVCPAFGATSGIAGGVLGRGSADSGPRP